jgi:hypothetical protein
VWVPYIKGEPTSPYFGDVPMVVNWAMDGREIKEFNRARYGSASRNVKSESHYGACGLVFPRRTSRFTPRIMPTGCIFSVGGQAIFAPEGSLWSLLGILSSSLANELIQPLLGRADLDPQFEVGAIGKIPLPPWDRVPPELEPKVVRLAGLIRSRLSNIETSSFFLSPTVSPGRESFRRSMEVATIELAEMRSEFEALVTECEETVNVLYEAQVVAAFRVDVPVLLKPLDETSEARSLVSYALGIAFRRYRQSHANGTEQCPDGNALCRDLPLSAPALRPLREVACDGEVISVLEDEPSSSYDVVGRTRSAFVSWWGTVGPDVWDEIGCAVAGTSDNLRPFFSTEFFALHLQTYSENKRKAPIYWQLSLPSKRGSPREFVKTFKCR